MLRAIIACAGALIVSVLLFVGFFTYTLFAFVATAGLLALAVTALTLREQSGVKKVAATVERRRSFERF